MKIASLLSLTVLLGTASIAGAQEDVGDLAFDLSGTIWEGSTISDEDQSRYIEDLHAFCGALKVSVEPLSASELEWLDAVAPISEDMGGRGVQIDEDDPFKPDRIWNSSAYVRENIIRASGFCVEITQNLANNFDGQSTSSRLGTLIYTITNLQTSVEAINTAGRHGWLLANAPGWRVETPGRGWSEIIRSGATTAIMDISAFLARNT